MAENGRTEWGNNNIPELSSESAGKYNIKKTKQKHFNPMFDLERLILH